MTTYKIKIVADGGWGNDWGSKEITIISELNAQALVDKISEKITPKNKELRISEIRYQSK